jgi:hypothetical protein
MPVCAAGHDSVATDYCDVCGLSFAPASAGGGAPAPATTVNAPMPDEPGEPCPNCGTPRAADERFCEVCGLDFTTGQMPAAPAAQPAAAAPDPAGASTASGPPTGWSVVITADAAWFADNAGGSADGIALPDPLPDPRIERLVATTSVGRAGSSTKPLIGIDDDAVSRKHCEIRQTVAGSWVVEDLGSTNGTYLDDATDPITPHTDTPLAAGTRIKLGAYSVLTLTQD